MSKHGVDANFCEETEDTPLCSFVKIYVVSQYRDYILTNEDETDNCKKIKNVIMLLILAFNADLTLKDGDGKTPLDYLSNPNFII